MSNEPNHPFVNFPPEIWLNILNHSTTLATLRNITIIKPELFHLDTRANQDGTVLPDQMMFSHLHKHKVQQSNGDDDEDSREHCKVKVQELFGFDFYHPPLSDESLYKHSQFKGPKAKILHTKKSETMPHVKPLSTSLMLPDKWQYAGYFQVPELENLRIEFWCPNQSGDMSQNFNMTELNDEILPNLKQITFGISEDNADDFDSELAVRNCQLSKLERIQINGLYLSEWGNNKLPEVKELSWNLPTDSVINDTEFDWDAFVDTMNPHYEYNEEDLKSFTTFQPEIYDTKLDIVLPKLEKLKINFPLMNNRFMESPDFIYLLHTPTIPLEHLKEFEILIDSRGNGRQIFFEQFQHLDLVALIHFVLSTLYHAFERLGENMKNFKLDSLGSSFYYSKRLINKVQKLKNIESLVIHGIAFNEMIQDEDLVPLFEFPHLKNVSIQYTGIHSNEDFINIKSPTLTSLNLIVVESFNGKMSNLDYSNYVEKLQENCPNLKDLTIKHIKNYKTRPRSYENTTIFPCFLLSPSKSLSLPNIESLKIELGVVETIQFFRDSKNLKLSNCINFELICNETSFTDFMFKDPIAIKLIDQLQQSLQKPHLQINSPMLEKLHFGLSFETWAPPRLSECEGDDENEDDSRVPYKPWSFEELPLFYQKVASYLSTIRLNYYENLKTITYSKKDLLFDTLVFDRRNYGVDHSSVGIGERLVDVRTYTSILEDSDTHHYID